MSTLSTGYILGILINNILLGYSIKQIDDSIDLFHQSWDSWSMKGLALLLLATLSYNLYGPNPPVFTGIYGSYLLFLFVWVLFDKNMYDQLIWRVVLGYSFLYICWKGSTLWKILTTTSVNGISILYYIIGLTLFCGAINWIEQYFFSEEASPCKLEFRYATVLGFIGLSIGSFYLYWKTHHTVYIGITCILLYHVAYLATSVRNLSQYLYQDPWKGWTQLPSLSNIYSCLLQKKYKTV